MHSYSARLLIAEDDRPLRQTYARILEGEGHEVIAASSLREARLQLAHYTPDLILLDLLLPDGDGSELVAQREARGCPSPIMVLSGVTDRDAMSRLWHVGIEDYLRKPVEMRHLAERVRATLMRVVRQQIIVRAGLVLDTRKCLLRSGVNTMRLTSRSTTLLSLLLERIEELVSWDEIAQLWEYSSSARTNTYHVHVSILRRALHSSGASAEICSVRGKGVVLKARRVITEIR